MVWQLLKADRFHSAATIAAPLAAESPQPHRHIPALDAIRGLAIVMVTLYRFGGGGDGAASAIGANWMVELGSRGVDLFFVLSGFLITGILFDAKGKEHYFRNFYIRRSLRIFPLYYGVLAAVVLLSLVSETAATLFRPAVENQAWLWLYGANVLQSVRGEWCLGPLNHFWSLAVEEHFYLAWPLVIFSTSRRTAMRICGCLIAASTLGRIGWLAAGGNDVAIVVLTPLRMDGLAFGSWLALAARSENGMAWLSRLALPAALVSGCFALATAIAQKRLLGLPETAWSCFFGALLVLVVTARPQTWLGRFGNSRLLRFFGKYSYAMYVFQNLLTPLMAALMTAPGLAVIFGSTLLGQAVYCICMFGLTTLVALASWHCFEKHFLSLKTRFGG